MFRKGHAGTLTAALVIGVLVGLGAQSAIVGIVAFVAAAVVIGLAVELMAGRPGGEGRREPGSRGLRRG